jgi:hypothetical protein
MKIIGCGPTGDTIVASCLKEQEDSETLQLGELASQGRS